MWYPSWLEGEERRQSMLREAEKQRLILSLRERGSRSRHYLRIARRIAGESLIAAGRFLTPRAPEQDVQLRTN